MTHDGSGVAYDGNLIVPPGRELACDILKELVWIYVIGDSGLAAQQHGQKRIITDLVDWIRGSPSVSSPKTGSRSTRKATTSRARLRTT